MVKFFCILCFIVGIITKLAREHLFNKLAASHNLNIENQSFIDTVEDIEELAQNGNSEAKFAIVIHRINLIAACLGISLIIFAIA